MRRYGVSTPLRCRSIAIMMVIGLTLTVKAQPNGPPSCPDEPKCFEVSFSGIVSHLNDSTAESAPCTQAHGSWRANIVQGAPFGNKRHDVLLIVPIRDDDSDISRTAKADLKRA